jgi:hypothetical protein
MKITAILPCKIRHGRIVKSKPYAEGDFHIDAQALVDLINSGVCRPVKIVDMNDYDALFRVKRRGSGWFYYLIGFAPRLRRADQLTARVIIDAQCLPKLAE